MNVREAFVAEAGAEAKPVIIRLTSGGYKGITSLRLAVERYPDAMFVQYANVGDGSERDDKEERV